MLRQKLLLILGSIVALLLACGLVAVLLLQSVLRDFEHLGGEAIEGASAAMALQVRISDLQQDLDHAGANHDTATFSLAVKAIREDLASVSSLEVVRGPAGASFRALDDLTASLGKLVADPARRPEALACAAAARDSLAILRQVMEQHAEREEQRMTARFRWIVIGLGLAFVLLINGSIMVLARMSSMILKPVDRLVEASRHLAREDFGHRIEIDRRDEFGELAAAYNRLAAQLQANEERRMETLQQAARTLNHELNNAMAIIQLQLARATRAAGADEARSQPLREIQDALTRMAGTVAALARVRRIVLTDYVSGVKMLDLEASVAE